ncbi:MAG: PrgI family protein [Candidatus Paceibacterota bacterium]
MRFQVPQFIEIESKIFGPLTFKQFVYLIGGAGIIFILFALLPFWLMIIFAVPVGAFAFALAFYKMNNQPFIKTVENALKFFSSSRVYIWKKAPIQAQKTAVEAMKRQSEMEQISVPKLTESKLKDLAWSLNIKEKIK